MFALLWLVHQNDLWRYVTIIIIVLVVVFVVRFSSLVYNYMRLTDIWRFTSCVLLLLLLLLLFHAKLGPKVRSLPQIKQRALGDTKLKV